MFSDFEQFNELAIAFKHANPQTRNHLYAELEQYFDMLIEQALSERVRWDAQPSREELGIIRQDCKAQMFIAFNTLGNNKRLYRYFETSAIHFLWKVNRDRIRDRGKFASYDINSIAIEPMQSISMLRAEESIHIKRKVDSLISSHVMTTCSYKGHMKLLKAIAKLLDNPNDYNEMTKKARLEVLRNMTGLTTKQINRGLKVLKPLLYNPHNS